MEQSTQGALFCTQCGGQVSAKANFCSGCGASVQDAPSQLDAGEYAYDRIELTNVVYPKHPPCSPHVALWNLLWPGIGHIILGQKAKGVTLMVAASILSGFSAGSLSLFIIIPSVIDAYAVGKVLKRGVSVGKWECFPSV